MADPDPELPELEEAAEADALVPVGDLPAIRHGARNPLRSLKDGNFAIAWSGMALSNIGSWAQSAVVPFVVYTLSDNAAIVGLVTFFAFLPAVVLGPLGGVCAERFERRRVVLVTSACSGAATALLWGTWALGYRSIVVLAVTVMISGAAAGLGHPSWQALVYDLADPSDIQNAITLNSGQFNLARAVGPALAGVLYARFGAGAVFAMNALSFGFAIAAMLWVRVARVREHRNPDATVRDGFRYMARRPAMLLPPIIIAFGIMASIPLLQLIPVLATDVLDVGPQQYGYLTAMFGIGGVVGAIVIGAFTHVLRRSLQIIGALLGMAIMTLALGFASSYVAALVAMFGIGFGFLTLASGTNTALQSAVDDQYRGRMLALYFMVVTATTPVYALMNGWITERFGIEVVMTIIAVAVGGLGVVLAVQPRLRRLLDLTRSPA